MHITSGSRAVSEPSSAAWSWLAVSAIAVLLALKFRLIFLQNINWDEFFFLSHVHSALRGDFAVLLQKLHVYAFAWLPYVSGNEVTQVIVARGVMFALQLGTCGFIFAVGRKLFGPAASVIGVLVYLTFSYTLDHGTSFRADPIAAFLLMAALWLIVRDRGGAAELLAAGLLTALAGLVTIKSIFYVPTLALAVLCLRRDLPTHRHVVEFLILGVTAIASFALIYLAHRVLFAEPSGFSATGMVAGSAAKMIMLDQLFPRAGYLVISLFRDPVAWLLLLGGFAAAIAVAVGRPRRRRGLGYAGLGLPLLTLIFYRNAYPYYYVFMLAAPALLGALAIAELARSLGRKSRAFQLALGLTFALLTLSFAGQYLRDDFDRTAAQRQLIDVVHRMFPQPVPYIDRSSMVASFPKVGFFMSTWGMENYLASGRPVMRGLLESRKPVFLVANIDSLRLDLPPEQAVGPDGYRLLQADYSILRDNFIHHWGAIWVAGKRLKAAAAGRAHRFEILIPGSYTVEAKAPVNIDGVERKPGATVELDKGQHTFAMPTAPATLILRWGVNLYRPAGVPVSDRLFVPFVRRRG